MRLMIINLIWFMQEILLTHAEIDTIATKNDLYFLKKLLAFRISELPNATAFSATTLPTIFTTAFLSSVATDAPTLQPLQSEFENYLVTNLTLDGNIKKAFLKAAPKLKGFGKNVGNMTSEEATSRHRALMEMAMEIKPFVEPLLSGFGPNLTEKISSVGQQFFPDTNHTARGGRGWGWGWGGGGGGGGSCCCCKSGGWGGGGGGGGGWGGGGDNALAYYLLSKNNNSDLSQLLPLLFGLIALLIMKLPT
ncbi:keratin, type I cytoskeletal 10-like [Paramacrobiotus metropolitanus]|uniref:keratin, type I cytoskeletal 10-like n=1 Tax=Paramacrobiotus metropolitanus TaxID=2943436 RepID=UPI002446225E|nr:keratin, type I cytoskeletal 10-like [Paramacrobiotus metropolitanus]